MTKPIGVISGDIHYNLNTMHVADKAVRQAISLANELNVPFIVNGDMLDQKALLRAEYVNMIIETFKTCKIKPYVNVGNHSRINEKSKEHALNFLAPYATIIEHPTYIKDLDSYIIPYDHDVTNLRNYLKTVPEGSRLFLHQGLNGSDMGDYIQDHSALNPEDLANFRSILSHYHNRQDIKCGRPRKGSIGLATYIGSPYTITFSEANDVEKSITIVMDNGSLEFVPTNLRKHIIIDIEMNKQTKTSSHTINPDDLVLVKVKGTKEYLGTYTKESLRKSFPSLPTNFRLDLIPLKIETLKQDKQAPPQNLLATVDTLTNVSNEQKERVKILLKEKM